MERKILFFILTIFISLNGFVMNTYAVNDSSFIDKISENIKDEIIDNRLIKDNSLCEPNGEYIYQLSSYLLEQYGKVLIRKTPNIGDMDLGDKLKDGIPEITNTIIKTFEFGIKNYREFVCEYGNKVIDIREMNKKNKDEINNIIKNWANPNYNPIINKKIDLNRYNNLYKNTLNESENLSITGFLKFWAGTDIDIIDLNYFNKNLQNNLRKYNKSYEILNKMAENKLLLNKEYKLYNERISLLNIKNEEEKNLHRDYKIIKDNISYSLEKFKNKFANSKIKYSKDYILNDVLYKNIIFYNNQFKDINKKIEVNKTDIWATKKLIDTNIKNLNNLTKNTSIIIKNF